MKYFMALDSTLTKVQPVHLWALLGSMALPLFPQTVSVTNRKALALANRVLLLLELQEGLLRYGSCHCPLYSSRDLCHKERQTHAEQQWNAEEEPAGQVPYPARTPTASQTSVSLVWRERWGQDQDSWTNPPALLCFLSLNILRRHQEGLPGPS